MSLVARSGFVGTVLLVGVALVAPGCGPHVEKRACMKVGTSDPLFTGAQLLKLDVYGATAKCSGNAVADGSGEPVMSHTYRKGDAITLDVPPGLHTLVLITYADKAGAMVLGQGCTTATLSPGAQICFDLSLGKAPPGSDMSISTACGTCPAGQYCDGTACVPGCAGDSDCALADGGLSTTPHCDLGSHQCVPCATAGLKMCNGACIAADSCCSAADCTTPPTPTSCYGATGTCSGPGGTCSYAENSGSQVCGTTCCNAIDGTCDSNCTLSCQPGALDCNGNPADGCETACAPANATGHCANAGGGCAIASCNGGFFDCNSNAGDGCECGTSCCTNPMTSMPGCLVKTHIDGYGHTFSACYPIGTPGTATTAGVGYGEQFAQDAASADVDIVGNCTMDTDCSNVQSGAKCINGACMWPTAKCFTGGSDYVESLCKFTISTANTSKMTNCACWAYAGTTGTCSNGVPCANYAGHTSLHTATSNGFCPCVGNTDSTYQ